jgi:hypothetical protein
LINGYVSNDAVVSWSSSVIFSCLIGGHSDKTHKTGMLTVLISNDQLPINGKVLCSDSNTYLVKNIGYSTIKWTPSTVKKAE